MKVRSRTIAVLTASALLLASVFLQGLPATASPPAIQEPGSHPLGSDTWAAPSGMGVQLAITDTAALMAVELLLAPIGYHVDLPVIANAAR